MIIKPKWYGMLPEHLHPEDYKIDRLDRLRQRLGFNDKLFFMAIANSRWSVIKAQEATLENFLKASPNATDKELWKGVLFSRLETKLRLPSPNDPSKQEIINKIEKLNETMQNINSYDELIDYILEMEKPNLDDNDPIQKQIDSDLLNY